MLWGLLKSGARRQPNKPDTQTLARAIGETSTPCTTRACRWTWPSASSKNARLRMPS
jgi:hypothetical protein